MRQAKRSVSSSLSCEEAEHLPLDEQEDVWKEEAIERYLKVRRKVESEIMTGKRTPLQHAHPYH